MGVISGPGVSGCATLVYYLDGEHPMYEKAQHLKPGLRELKTNCNAAMQTHNKLLSYRSLADAEQISSIVDSCLLSYSIPDL